MRNHFARITLFGDHSLIHEEQLISDFPGETDLVRHNNHGHASFRQIAHHQNAVQRAANRRRQAAGGGTGRQGQCVFRSFANERSSLIDPAAYRPRAPTLGAKFDIRDLFSLASKAAYRLRSELEHVSLHGK